MARTAYLVCFISTVNGHNQEKEKKCGASSGHITNLKQSIFSMNKAITISVFTLSLSPSASTGNPY